MSDPWGLGEPGFPCAPELAPESEGCQRAGTWAVVYKSPQLVAARAAGWAVLDASPLYRLLPAAWPPGLRSWISDPWDDDNSNEWPDDHLAEQKAGLPPRPSGRIWLLRSPWANIPVSAVYALLRSWSGPKADATSMYAAAQTVLRWDEQKVLEALPEEIRDLLESWAEVGRSGEANAEAIEFGLSPGEVSRLIRLTGLSEDQLVAWLRELNVDPDDAFTEFIQRWRHAGLPDDPPRGVDLHGGRDAPELRRWVDAGFDIDDAIRFDDISLSTAIRWRDEGFTVADVHELLSRDRTLTVEEALSFDGAGIDSDQRLSWVYFGFSAAEAERWSVLGIGPADARGWRARGVAPSQAQRGRQNDMMAAAEARNQPGRVPEHVVDPPGTRGAAAIRGRANIR